MLTTSSSSVDITSLDGLDVDDDEDDLFVDLRPTIDKTTAEEKFDSLMASSKERREPPAPTRIGSCTGPLV